MAVFWVVAPCSLIEIYLRFRGVCCLHHQASKLLPDYTALQPRRQPSSCIFYFNIFGYQLQTVNSEIPTTVWQHECISCSVIETAVSILVQRGLRTKFSIHFATPKKYETGPQTHKQTGMELCTPAGYIHFANAPCAFAYIPLFLNVHVFQIQIHCFKADHITDTRPQTHKWYVLYFIKCS
jgi:hypothetical protein